MGKVVCMPPELMRMAEVPIWDADVRERRATCLDCRHCETMEAPYDGAVRAVLGHGLGFCRKYREWVTDEESAEELGNVGVCYEEVCA